MSETWRLWLLVLRWPLWPERFLGTGQRRLFALGQRSCTPGTAWGWPRASSHCRADKGSAGKTLWLLQNEQWPERVTRRGFGDSPSPQLACYSTLLAPTSRVGSWGRGCRSSTRRGIALGGRGARLHAELSSCAHSDFFLSISWSTCGITGCCAGPCRPRSCSGPVGWHSPSLPTVSALLPWRLWKRKNTRY